MAGGLLAIFVDLTDLYWMNVLDLGGIPNYQVFDKLADQFLAVVPSAIKTDAHTLVDGVKQIEGVLKDANWDITKVDQAKLQSFNDPKFEDAAKRIDAYNEQVCGLKSGSSGSSTP